MIKKFSDLITKISPESKAKSNKLEKELLENYNNIIKLESTNKKYSYLIIVFIVCMLVISFIKYFN